MTVHGGTANGIRTPEYRAWRSMRHRCKNAVTYIRAGIRVCEAWERSFGQFLADVGPMPAAGMRLDRMDGRRGYEPGNVRWATLKENARNKACNHFLTFRGVTRCVTEWAEVLGCSRRSIRNRLKRGMTVDEALGLPFTYSGRPRPTGD